MRHATVVLAVLALCAAAAAATVHLRTASGEWIDLEADTDGDVVSFRITPEQAPEGRALVVINKPDWMVLDDDTPPRIISYCIGEGIWELSDASSVTLTGLGDADWQRQVKFNVTDDANPIDPNSALLSIEGRPSVRLELVKEERENHSAQFMLDLNTLGPGAYDGAIEVADLSPQRNTARLPIRFSIFGIEIAAEGQEVRVGAGGAAFTLRGHNRQTIVVDQAGVSAFPTIQAGGPYIYVRALRTARELEPVAGWHVVEAEAELEDIDGNPVTDEEVGLRVRLVLFSRPDLPVLVVRTEVTNLGAAREIYAFWGWLPGEGYVTSDGEAHRWSMQYQDFGHPGWVYLPQDGKPGVGWISPHLFGESRFGSMLLYTDPKHQPTDTGATMVMTFALMPAAGPEAVGEATEALARSTLEAFHALAEP
ncbi:MAG: hypothetical protein AB7Y46_15700 [Armatimonadota bacterium]